MKRFDLRSLIFLALCCDLGLVAKRLINPLANIITDSLHIPGGIGTSFSLMFLVIAVVLVPQFGCGALVGVVQSGMALCLGMVGSMGALSPIGYILPGLVTDMVMLLGGKIRMQLTEKMLVANMIAGVTAAFTANCIVFHLQGIVLLLYLCVAATSGSICGLIGAQIVKRLTVAVKVEKRSVGREFV